MRPVLAVDVDLRKIFAWSNVGGEVVKGTPDASHIDEWLQANWRWREGPVVLVEVAGAVDYSDNKAIAHNKRRWTIWNIAMAARIWEYCVRRQSTMLVAPSSKWTHGHDVKVRHTLCAATAKNKDLRECESMLWFFDKHPEDWVLWDKYLDTL